MTKHTFDASQIPNVTWKTIDDLYREGDPDCVAMYLKYCYHANIQGTNQVYANLSFMTGRDQKGHKVRGGLDWGRDKTRRVRQKLVELGCIELLPQKNTGKHGELGKSYTKINHLVGHKKMESALLKGSSPVRLTNCAEGIDKQRKCLNDDENKFLKDNHFSKNDKIGGEGTYVGGSNNTARLPRWEYDNDGVSSIPFTNYLSLDEKNYIYDKIIEIDPNFEEKWDSCDDDWLFDNQRLKVIQNYEANSTRPKSRRAFLARIIEYTVNGGTNRLFEEW